MKFTVTMEAPPLVTQEEMKVLLLRQLSLEKPASKRQEGYLTCRCSTEQKDRLQKISEMLDLNPSSTLRYLIDVVYEILESSDK